MLFHSLPALLQHKPGCRSCSHNSPEGYLYLTESGLATAEKIYERHLFLSEWLEKLGVNPIVAASDACKIEHVISSESFAAIKKHIDLDSMK